jgi:DNA helicase-2/ATP-dependent DNA helicase PcrA
MAIAHRQPTAATAPAADAWLAALNAQQRQAVLHGTGEGAVPGPLLVIAGAGTGKTDTLAHRVAHLVRQGADPQRILLLTFSRRAAGELEKRAGRVLARALGTGPARTSMTLPWAGTFHAVGARLLREYARRIGLDPAFTIHDRGDAEDQLALVRHELGFATTRKRFPAKATCLAIYSRVVNSEAPLAAVLAAAFPWCAGWERELKALFAAYVTAKQAQNVLDYDDLLLYWAGLVAEPGLAAEVGARFDHILVDEYQDTNRLQASILRALKPTGRGVTVVGDDAQSIYSFRAATVRNILDFPQAFAQPASVVTLERNYRSTQPILDASNAVIGLARERHAKNLWTERSSTQKPELVTVRDEADEARCVAERVLEHREEGIALKAQAVLFRTSSHSAQLELELGRRDIPFVKFGGLRFLEAAHVKDVLSILRWAENPKSRIAGFRALRLLPGVGPATATRVLDAVAVTAEPLDALTAFAPPAAAADGWPAFVAVIGALRRGTATWPAEFDLVADWYEPQVERLYDDAPARAGDIAQLRAIAGTYVTRERFLTELTLDPPNATSAEAGTPTLDDDYLILSTIHSAKGQEWKSVQVLNVVDGCIPSDLATGTQDEIEEERRLLYVAMTRARDHLRLLLPQRFHVHGQAAHGDRHVYAAKSRFLPRAVLPFFDQRAWPAADPGDAGAGTDALSRHEGPPIDVAARIRALWR